MKIIYIHHALRQRGNPPSQEDGICPLGEKDAENVAELLGKIKDDSNIKAIYTSPYFRCKKTAEILNRHMNVTIFEEPRFNEFNKVFDVVEDGKTITKNETWIDCQIRIREALRDIVNTYDKKDTIVCVTSGVNITAFISLAFKLQPGENWPFPWVPSCSPIGFEIDKSCFLNEDNN